MSDNQFFQIDAFAERPMAGGPAGVMPMEAFPADAVMQAIAAENNLAETAFIAASSVAIRILPSTGSVGRFSTARPTMLNPFASLS